MGPGSAAKEWRTKIALHPSLSERICEEVVSTSQEVEGGPEKSVATNTSQGFSFEMIDLELYKFGVEI